MPLLFCILVSLLTLTMCSLNVTIAQVSACSNSMKNANQTNGSIAFCQSSFCRLLLPL